MTERPKFRPQESERAFLQMIKAKGGISLKEALSFEDLETYWFGPGIDAFDILHKYKALGVIYVDTLVGLYRIAENPPKPEPVTISLPEKVTVTLRNPERETLQTPEYRVLLDLITVTGPIPYIPIYGQLQVHSLVYLAQEFTAIDAFYNFEPESGFRPQPWSNELSWNLSGLDGAITHDRSTWHVSSKYQELLEIIGGPQMVKNTKVVEKLAELSRLQRSSGELTRFSKFVFLEIYLARDLEKKTITREIVEEITNRWFPGTEEREELKKLKRELRIMSLQPGP